MIDAVTIDEHEPKTKRPVPFAWDVLRVDDRAIVSVRGDLDLATAPVLLRELSAMMLEPISDLTLELEQLTFLDSSGLDTLVRASRCAAAVGIGYAVESVPVQARQVIELTGLDGMLGVTP